MQDPALPASAGQTSNDNTQTTVPVDPGQDLDQLTKDPLPTFSEEVNTFESGRPKEQEPHAHHVESIEVVQEIPTTPEIEPQHEIAGYMEKIEKEAELTNAVTDDYTQQVLLTSSAPQNPTITLPLTEEQVKLGLHHKVWEAITWLAWWCFRQVQLLPGRVKYKQ